MSSPAALTLVRIAAAEIRVPSLGNDLIRMKCSSVAPVAKGRLSRAVSLGAEPVRHKMLGPYKVSVVAVGGARWSLRDEPDDELAEATLLEALELGVTMIDTAPAYTTVDQPSHNETLIGRVLSVTKRHDSVTVSTKGGHGRRGDGTFFIDGRPSTLRKQCEASLMSLKRDSVSLYSLHWPDPVIPIEESVGALDELRDEGMVEMIGLSNVDVSQIQRALSVANIDSVQNSFSLLDRSSTEVVSFCADHDIAFLAHSPLGGSSGVARIGTEIDGLSGIANAHGATVYQVALAWLIVQGPVIPIVGAGRPSSIRDAVAAADLSLSRTELHSLGRPHVLGGHSRDKT